MAAWRNKLAWRIISAKRRRRHQREPRSGNGISGNQKRHNGGSSVGVNKLELSRHGE